VISLPSGTSIWITAGVTDMRRGFTGLSAVAQTVLEQNPYSGHIFVFRGKRGDLIKLLWWDGDGLCRFAKRLEFPVRLNSGCGTRTQSVGVQHKRGSGYAAEAACQIADRNLASGRIFIIVVNIREASTREKREPALQAGTDRNAA